MSESAIKICPSCSSEAPGGAKFCGNCGHALQLPQDDRREVVVLFADVTGFTTMSERLDPEDVYTLMNECFAGIGKIVQSEEGFVDRYLGDAVVAIFGAPEAHEDDPARACRVALSMQAFLGEFAEKKIKLVGHPLKMRIGIHCGWVVAGKIGSEARKVYGAQGDTMNTASRIQNYAPPGGIILSEKTAKRVRGLFEFGPIQYFKAKGKGEAIEVRELLSALDEPQSTDRVTLDVPLIGRETERHHLIKKLKSIHGEDRWIEVVGELGIGKTRLIQEVIAHTPGFKWLKVFPQSGWKRRPYELVRQFLYVLLEQEMGLATRPETKASFASALEKLDGNLVPYIDALWHLGAPTRLSVPVPDPNPQTLRRTVERGILLLLKSLGAKTPELVLFIDSYELVDDASADLFESLAKEGKGLPFPILVALRENSRSILMPEKAIKLGHLSEEEGTQMLEKLVHGAQLSEALKTNVLERGAGNPRHIVELVGVLVDEKVLTSAPKGEPWLCNPEKTSVLLPPSIRAAMMSRLDRLERPERDFLCQCSILGTEFNREVVELVSQEEGKLEQPAVGLLQKLLARGLVQRIREETWGFCEPLMQETCYESLLVRERIVLHGKMAAALCTVEGGADRVSPELLAYHYEGARQWAQASEANFRAGTRASELFLNDEAVRRFEHAIELNGFLDTPTDETLRINMLAHKEITCVFLRVGKYQLAESHGQAVLDLGIRSSDRAEAQRLVAASFFHRGQMDIAEELLQSAQKLSQEEGPGGLVGLRICMDLAELYHRQQRISEALNHLGQCRGSSISSQVSLSFRADMLEGRIAHTKGRFIEAETLFLRAYEAAEKEGGLSERAHAINSLGNVARDLGDYDKAKCYFQSALTIWEQTGDVECIAGGHNNLGNLMMSMGDFPPAHSHLMESIAGCRKIGNVHGLSLAQANLAILAMEEGDPSMAVASAEAALETLEGTGNELLKGLVLVVLAEGRLECGHGSAAQTLLKQVLDEYDEASHPLAIAGAYRGLGRIGLLRGNFHEGVECFNKALSIFEKLKRAQESARTVLFKAEALWRLGEVATARLEVDKALKRFMNIGAQRDIVRARELFEQFNVDSP